jgi:branched-chain amino acid transport system ATP-binding protein
VPLLEVTGLEVRYGGVRAVRGIDLRVDSGGIAVALGANGAGKTSTLRAICGLEPKSAGKVVWDEQNISRWPSYRIARSGLVLVPEGRRIFAPLSVEENLLVGAYSNRHRAKRQELLDRVYGLFPVLLERRSGRAGLLSGGEQQMLAFGRAMMAYPRMILADEPSMGLSPLIIDIVMNSIASIAATGIGVFMVEQNANAALAIAKTAIVLDRGEIVLEGSAEEIRSHPDVVKAFLGEQGAASPRGVEK